MRHFLLTLRLSFKNVLKSLGSFGIAKHGFGSARVFVEVWSALMFQVGSRDELLMRHTCVTKYSSLILF